MTYGGVRFQCQRGSILLDKQQAALIGPGVFASHGYERTHMESMKATYDLIMSYAVR